MKNRPFSLTVNGDYQLDINVSYLDDDLLVKKRMFTTTALERGTTALICSGDSLQFLLNG